MKLLLDQGMPRSTAALSRQAGFDAVRTGEISLAGWRDKNRQHCGGADRRTCQVSEIGFGNSLRILKDRPKFRA